MAGPILTAMRFPAPHGFSTRHGGVSTGAFASLNLGFSVGDARENVEENVRRLARLAEVAPSALRTISQVHGATVLKAAPLPESDRPSEVCGEADALVTENSGEAVGVKTADCVPILLA